MVGIRGGGGISLLTVTKQKGTVHRSVLQVLIHILYTDKLIQTEFSHFFFLYKHNILINYHYQKQRSKFFFIESFYIYICIYNLLENKNAKNVSEQSKEASRVGGGVIKFLLKFIFFFFYGCWRCERGCEGCCFGLRITTAVVVKAQPTKGVFTMRLNQSRQKNETINHLGMYPLSIHPSLRLSPSKRQSADGAIKR